VRLLRLLRLVRLLKAKRILSDLKARLNSPSAVLAIDISRLLFVGGCLAHGLACLWYLFGTFSTRGWVYTYGIQEKGLADRYLWSFQFALARLHPSNAQSNLALNTTGERVLAIMATLFALVFTSIFISTVTTTMAEMKRMRAARLHQRMLLAEYTKARGIGSLLAGQVRNWLKHAQSTSSDMRDRLDPELFELLPPRLMTELRLEAWSAVLARNPLFSMIRSKHPRAECKLCYEALSEIHLFQRNALFTTGDACTRLFFTVTGTCAYLCGKDPDARLKLQRGGSKIPNQWTRQISNGSSSEPSIDEQVEETRVNPNTWLCEASLYTAWTHCGDFRAHTDAMLLGIGADEVAMVVKQYEQAFVDVVIYAKVFIEELNRFKGQYSDLSREYYDGDDPLSPSPSPGKTTGISHLSNLTNVFFGQPATSRSRRSSVNSVRTVTSLTSVTSVTPSCEPMTPLSVVPAAGTEGVEAGA